MHQGNDAVEERNFETKLYAPESLDFILLTHAHIDHSGLLPRMVANGFKGDIYCTPPTASLATIMLEDSAHIQEMDTAWKRKKQARNSGQPDQREIEPLYTVEDAQKVPQQFHTVEYNQSFQPFPGISITYRDAGHILGSAFIEIVITEDGKKTKLVFSGDLGRPGTLLMHDPSIAAQADYLFLESTYGDRNHKNEDATLDELAEAIAYSYGHHEKVIIPAFAVGRTQEILYCLYLLSQKGQLPSDIPIFVDSPLAVRATEIFKEFKEYLDVPEVKITQNMTSKLPNIHFTLNSAESQALNTMSGPAIIISASGMCNAGRIRHHLRHNIWKPGVSIVFVGYQGMGTPGRKIVNGAKSIRILNEEVAIKARVFTIGGFSAHAGQSQLLEWVSQMQHPGMHVVLVHGEEKAQNTLAEIIRETYKLSVSIPAYLDEMELQPGLEPQVAATRPPRRVDWNFLLATTENQMAQLRARLANASDLAWEDQMDVRDRLLELNRDLLAVLAQL